MAARTSLAAFAVAVLLVCDATALAQGFGGLRVERGGGLSGPFASRGAFTVDAGQRWFQGQAAGNWGTDSRAAGMVGPSGQRYQAIGRMGYVSTPWGSGYVGDARVGMGPTGFGMPAGGTSTARLPTDLGPVTQGLGQTYPTAGSSSLWLERDVRHRANRVRTEAAEQPLFSREWFETHPDAWQPDVWAGGAKADPATPATWANLSAWCGIAGAPVVLDYGNTVVFSDNDVFIHGKNVGPADQYATQAVAVSDAGRNAPLSAADEWLPLGVFCVIQNDESASREFLQLAVNKRGILRGNYYQKGVETVAPVFGKLDAASQRAVWSMGKSRAVVFEAGAYNLTKAHTTVLFLFGTERREPWLLVALTRP